MAKQRAEEVVAGELVTGVALSHGLATHALVQQLEKAIYSNRNSTSERFVSKFPSI
jgi:hypothetical protein